MTIPRRLCPANGSAGGGWGKEETAGAGAGACAGTGADKGCEAFALAVRSKGSSPKLPNGSKVLAVGAVEEDGLALSPY